MFPIRLHPGDAAVYGFFHAVHGSIPLSHSKIRLRQKNIAITGIKIMIRRRISVKQHVHSGQIPLVYDGCVRICSGGIAGLRESHRVVFERLQTVVKLRADADDRVLYITGRGEDLGFMCIGILLGALAGRAIFGDLIDIGTLAGAFGTGPIMKWFMNLTEQPFQKWFGPLRKTAQPQSQ